MFAQIVRSCADIERTTVQIVYRPYVLLIMCYCDIQKDLEEETIYEQFLIVKALTEKSDVHEYGQLASICANNDTHMPSISLNSYDPDIHTINVELSKNYDWLAVNKLSLNHKKLNICFFIITTRNYQITYHFRLFDGN